MYHHIIEDDESMMALFFQIYESHLYYWYLRMLQTLTAIYDKATTYAAVLLLAHHGRKACMARNWKRESIPKATENVRMLWRKKYKDKAPTVHLSIESTKEPDEIDLWGRDQSTISQVGDEFDSFIDGNLVLLGERETSLSLWIEKV